MAVNKSIGGEADRDRAPAITLPKGGGAIRGIDEKFSINPANGTGSLSVPIYASPGRSGFGPRLTISYDSGGGNGPFGLGWNLAIPSITRKTDKGVPRYRDTEDSDTFILSGAEDLVPVLVERGARWVREVLEAPEYGDHRVERYRPRTEGLFARIERWQHKERGDVHWRATTSDNVTSVYGASPGARISDPQDPTRVYSWLLELSYDDKGNLILYEYKREDGEDVDRSRPQERNRLRNENGYANLYLKRIKYGNRRPYTRGSRVHDISFGNSANDWLFAVVFDYGEHDEAVPTPEEVRPWPSRVDPFSTCRAGFDIRTQRRCHRVLMFHRFPDELDETPCLVRSTDFAYDESPFLTYLRSVTQTGYVRQHGGVTYKKSSLPPLEFDYTRFQLHEEVRFVPADRIENLPVGIDDRQYQWVDLDGEGISGVLAERSESWLYKRNLSQVDVTPGQDVIHTVRFAPVDLVAPYPSLANLGARGQQILDLAGDGRKDLVLLGEPVSGFYERDPEHGWTELTPFRSFPRMALDDPNLRFVDLNGDGHADILITEDDVFTWYPSLAEDGFGAAVTVPKTADEEDGPALVFSDATQSIYLADMSGDGLVDIARIRNGEVCYWPNLGYARFGAKVTMDGAPFFDPPDLFDQRRIRLADIDGSGTTDILYLGRHGVSIWCNQAGNAWSERRQIGAAPQVDSHSRVSVVDLFGNGTACVVWSSPLPDRAHQPLAYIDLMDGRKPHLLESIRNNLGAETRLQYVSSTNLYLQDLQAGTPWVTRLPFPVHVVEKVEVFDHISKSKLVNTYRYRHGFYDGEEREFRGFGFVEQEDTESFSRYSGPGLSGAPPETAGEAFHLPAVRTRTWLHTGAHLEGVTIARQFAREYYREPALDDAAFLATLLPDTTVPTGLTAEEERQAARALKGSVLRQETYARDGSPKEDHPYTVSEFAYRLTLVQPAENGRHAVLYAYQSEALTSNYERNPADPRVGHALTLEVDQFGNALKSAAIGYGRRQPDPKLEPQDQAKQAQTLITYTENEFTNSVDEPGAYRTPLPCESCTYELTGLTRPAGRSRFASVDVQTAGEAASILTYEQTPTPGALQKRRIEHARALYRRDDLSGSLPLRQAQSRALPFESYKLALTPGLVAGVFAGRVTDTMLENDGGYVHSEGDADWWVPSGRMFYSADGNDTPSEELTYAGEHFFLPQRFRDPFGQTATVTYDPYDLLVLETRDALDNRVTAGERDPDGNLMTSGNDYRVLQPRLVMDPNRNRIAVAFDPVGIVVGTAVMGKPEEHLGDSLDGFDPDLPVGVIAAHLQEPRASPHDILQRATTRLVYDLFAFYRTKDETDPQPAVVYTMARETHDSDPVPAGGLKIQHSLAYSDGYGREIQKKTQAEKGLLPLRDANGRISLDPDGRPIRSNDEREPRWVGSGWTVFNNKGKPVLQYEPFFTDTHRFEFEARIGVSPVLFYDPVERVVAALHPNHTYEKVLFDPWRQVTHDVNDTVTANAAESGDPRTDNDIKGYVAAYFRTQPDTWQTWHQKRITGTKGAQEKGAAEKAAKHANTPMSAHFDTLGRAFLTLADNGPDPAHPGQHLHFATRVELDIEGNQRAVRDAIEQAGDAQGRVVKRYDYDQLANCICQSSMEAGARWTLNDVEGKPIRGWDSRGHIFVTTYDALRRPAEQYVRGTTSDSDPRTLNPDILVDKIEYGEAQTDAERMNLRTRIYRHYDSAGIATNAALNPISTRTEAYDFKGNVLRTTRQLVSDYTAIPDWRLNPTLDEETFTSSARYDALNRPVQSIAPHSSLARAKLNIIQPAFNEANLLERVDVWLDRNAEPPAPLDPAVDATSSVGITNIDYDANGQRQRIEYKNGASTRYRYDEETFRLIHLYTRRGATFNKDCDNPQPPPATVAAPEVPSTGGYCGLLNLYYTYDPVGNITYIRDDAQQTIYFKNQRVDPSNDYTYDAIYRLIEAKGREHLGQIGGAPIPHSHNDSPRVGIWNQGPGNGFQPGDGNAMGPYCENYVYDAVGNIMEMIHRRTCPGVASWTRTYAYGETSLIEDGMGGAPLKTSNRLSSTTVSNNNAQDERYVYDAHGNMTRMPHLGGAHPAPNIHWDHRDQLRQADLGGGGTAYYVYDGAGQRVRKVWEKSANLIEERLYLGGFEVYRRRRGAERVERETLHLMDDKQRIALVETRTLDTAGNDPAPQQVIRYQFGNHLGSASQELDDQAQIISYEEYTPYGSTSYQAVRSQRETPNRYRYAGKERDEESGSYCHGARYYAPWLGRWLSADPAGMVDGTNLYMYVRDNPVRFSDPTAMAASDEAEAAFRRVRERVVKAVEDYNQVQGFGEKYPPLWGAGEAERTIEVQEAYVKQLASATALSETASQVDELERSLTKQIESGAGDLHALRDNVRALQGQLSIAGARARAGEKLGSPGEAILKGTFGTFGSGQVAIAVGDTKTGSLVLSEAGGVSIAEKTVAEEAESKLAKAAGSAVTDLAAETGEGLAKKSLTFLGKRALKALPILPALWTLFGPSEAGASERVARAVAGEIGVGPFDLELVWDFYLVPMHEFGQYVETRSANDPAFRQAMEEALEEGQRDVIYDLNTGQKL